MEQAHVKPLPVKPVKSPRLSIADIRSIQISLAYIDKHFTERISAEHLSMEVGLSKEKLQQGLQHVTGMTLHKYIQQVRMEKARELLANTNDPVKAIADAAGFINESHFCRVFRKMFMISPIQYRFQQVC